MLKTYSTDLAGRTLTIETGKMAELANGSVLVRYGETVVMVNVTASKSPRDGIDFFPLSVDYEEKLYSVGKVPGSFMKREGKPSEKAILTSRVIDRPIRPLFPKDYRNDVCVNAMVLSVEQDNAPEIAAMIGSSIAISISDIPFAGPTGSVAVGYVDGKIIINPTQAQREKSTLELTVAGTKDKIAMIEAGANEIPDEIMLEAIKLAHEEIKKICIFIEGIQKEIGKPKMEYTSAVVDEEVYKEIEENFKSKMKKAVLAVKKEERDENIEKLTEEVEAFLSEKHGEDILSEKKQDIADALYKLEKKAVRYMILEEKKRPDGRGINDIRSLAAEVGILPRVHGSGMFTRGQTQVLSVATLGMKSEEQLLDGIDEEESKRYMHHYNFPPFSVGEAKSSRGPGRREIGHGALAERALEPVIPNEEEFPYTIRVVSEVLSSNGSTSQASICGSTLALMDAGVPIRKPVAGISTGLVTDENDPNRYVMITDIQGLEDFFGDMDFKVAGTKDGITAIQVDIKIDGLTLDIIKEAFERTKNARKYILDEVMAPVIDKPRAEMSKYAPRFITLTIDTEKIREVIGPGGKMINKIIAETGVKMDIEDNGKVLIYSTTPEAGEKASAMVNAIVRDAQVGDIYEAKVLEIREGLGAFVEIGPEKRALLHISQIAKERVEIVGDYLKIGDVIKVKVSEINEKGVKVTKKGLEE